VREDGRVVGGKEWQEKVYNRQEWKKLLRTAKNCHILHMPMEYSCAAVPAVFVRFASWDHSTTSEPQCALCILSTLS
jgi:hypothetical protein